MRKDILKVKCKRKNRHAFSMIELLFVIVIIGILSKFGVEFVAQAYNNFIFSSINNRLQSQSATAIEFISTRLQHRIKDSTIIRATDATFVKVANPVSTKEYRVLEWIGSDIDGFRGNSDEVNTTFNAPNWSGMIDLNLTTATTIVSPQTDTTKTNELINILSYGLKDINDSAIYFIGADSGKFGWDGIAISTQNEAMHPIKSTTSSSEFNSSIAGVDFSGVEVFEYYKLAWTAYAIEHDTNTSELTLFYDYQPWNGDSYKDAKNSALIMENVNTFRFTQEGDLIKIQICVESTLIDNQEYSICKEKIIY